MREDRGVHAPASPLVLKEKGQKLIHKVGVNSIKSGFTAGAKTYGGTIKNARGESEAPGASLQTGTSGSGTVAADEQ